MGIKCTTPKKEIARYSERMLAAYREKVIAVLKYVGDKAVTEARENHWYQNQTGNLESSIGYCIAENGRIIFGGDFEVVKDGHNGAEEGRKFLQRLVEEHSSGLVLIVVAGMEYAAFVEAKNLNVLDSAEQLTERLLPQMIKDIKF